MLESIVRKAEKKDAAAILHLMRELISFHYSLDPYYRPASKFSGLSGYIHKSIKDPKKIFLVAESGEQIIGYLLSSVEPAPTYSSEKNIGLIADACIGKEYRRQGVLKNLFQDALDRFKKKDVNYVELSVDFRNTPAVSAWKNLGFKDYKLRLRKKIPRP